MFSRSMFAAVLTLHQGFVVYNTALFVKLGFLAILAFVPTHKF
jgi:hypothetical protein